MFAKKETLTKVLQALQKLVRRFDHPALSAALGEIYVEALEKGQAGPSEAVEFLQRAADKAPSSARAHELLARTLAEASRRSTDASLRGQTVEEFERAVQLKRREAGSLLVELAHLHLQAGESKEAQDRLSAVAGLDPDNEDAKKLLDRFATGDGLPAAPTGYDCEKLAKEFGKIRGFLAAVVVDRAGTIVAERNAMNVEGRKVANALVSVFNNARDASLRMEIGAFERCEIDGPFGRAYVAALGGVALLAAFDESAKGEAAPGRLDHLIESCALGDELLGSDS